jgi:transporter family protein
MALYSICIKVSSRTVHPILGGVILQLVAVLLGSAMLGVSTRMDKTKYDLDFRGALWSVCAGMAVGAAEIVSFKVSAMGVQASQLIPVMIGGSVAFGSVMGVVMLKERMTLRGWLGVFLVIAGIVFVATDPGANIGH